MQLLQSTPTPLPGHGGGWFLFAVAGLALVAFLLMPVVIGIVLYARRRYGIAAWKTFLGAILTLPVGYVLSQAVFGDPGEVELETIVTFLAVVLVVILIPVAIATAVIMRLTRRAVDSALVFGMVGVFGGFLGILAVAATLGASSGGGGAGVLFPELWLLLGDVVGTTMGALVALRLRTAAWWPTR